MRQGFAQQPRPWQSAAFDRQTQGVWKLKRVTRQFALLAAVALLAVGLSRPSAAQQINASITGTVATVRQPTREQGRIAAEALVRRMESAETPAREERVMKCELVVRASTVAE